MLSAKLTKKTPNQQMQQSDGQNQLSQFSRTPVGVGKLSLSGQNTILDENFENRDFMATRDAVKQ